MTFKTDGSTHTHGVKNEHEVIAILNERGIFNEQVTHLGGTKNKADAIAGSKKISIKHKKGIKNGSYDYANTSIYNGMFKTHFDKFLSDVKEHREMPQQLREVAVDFMRKDFSDLCESALESIDRDTLVSMLVDIFSKQSGYDVVINDTQSKEVYIFKSEDHPVWTAIKMGYTPELVSGRGAKSSRKIVFKNGNYVINTGLRIRVTSNNGINAFLGLSRANKNSQIVVKLQQDSIAQLVKDSGAEVYSY